MPRTLKQSARLGVSLSSMRGVGQAEVLGERRADRRVVRQFEQAGGIGVEAQFLRRAQHAVGLDAAQLRGLDRDARRPACRPWPAARPDPGARSARRRRSAACSPCRHRPGRPAGGRLPDASAHSTMRATTTPSRRVAERVSSSTSRPIAVSVAASSSRVASVAHVLAQPGFGEFHRRPCVGGQANWRRKRTSLSKKLRRSSTP